MLAWGVQDSLCWVITPLKVFGLSLSSESSVATQGFEQNFLDLTSAKLYGFGQAVGTCLAIVLHSKLSKYEQAPQEESVIPLFSEGM